MTDEIDHFDRRILNIVQKDASAKSEAIAENVGLSASAVQRRLKRLRDKKIISAEIAVINQKLVGRPMFFVASAEIDRERPELLAKIRRAIDDEDAIQQAYYVTGSADLIMVVTAETVEEYHSITGRLIEANPAIRRITTNVGLHAFKRGLFVPVA